MCFPTCAEMKSEGIHLKLYRNDKKYKRFPLVQKRKKMRKTLFVVHSTVFFAIPSKPLPIFDTWNGRGQAPPQTAAATDSGHTAHGPAFIPNHYLFLNRVILSILLIAGTLEFLSITPIHFSHVDKHL